MEFSRAARPARSAQHSPILLLAVTLNTEYNALEKYLPMLRARRQPQSSSDQKLNIDRWIIPRPVGQELKVATGFIHGMGNTFSALETYIILERVSPAFVFLCGIAGSLRPNAVPLGDVVVANAVDWWNLNKVTGRKFDDCLSLGNRHFRVNPTRKFQLTTEWDKRLALFCKNYRDRLPSNVEADLLKFRQSVAPANGTLIPNKLHLGGLLSWEYVLNDQGLRDTVARRSPGTLAVEMEGGGFDYALRRRREEYDHPSGRPIGFIFRGISDLSHGKDEEHRYWRELAMYNATAALIEFLGTFSDETFAEGWIDPSPRPGSLS